MVLGALVIIVVGVLVVNYVKDRGSLLKEGGVATSNQTSANSHTVVPGETLWAISENYYGTGYKWVDIAKANSLQNADKIEVGQTLTLPEVTVATAETTLTPDTSYTVQKGDHLWGIAVREYGDGYKWVEVARVNKLKNPNLLFIGTVLTLPR